jgi:peptidoglycan/LPS O-acetylase OafA/YrhL
MNNFSIYFGTTPYQSLNVNVGNANYELKTFLGNILFLYKDYVPIFGTNGPTWSLKFEWWFYMLYPIFLILSRKHIYYSTALIFILFVASFYPSFWPSQLLQEIFGSMVCWWLGVLLAEVSAKRLPIKMPAFAMMSFLVVILLLFLKNKGATLQDLQTAFLFTFILGILLWLNEKGVNLKFLEKLKPFGDFSYTLYIIHFPILTLLSGVVMKRLNNTLPIHFYFVFGGIAICLFIAYLLHFIVEVPFTKSKPNNTEQNNFFIAGIKRLILR